MLKARRRLLGVEQPQTSFAAWNLVESLFDGEDTERAAAIGQDYFVPLLPKKSRTLSAYPRWILGRLAGLNVRGRPAR